MNRPQFALTIGALLLACVLAAGCQDDKPTVPPVVPPVALDPVPDFSLVDVNPTSATADQAVSPRDYLQQVSGWYFGHST